MPKVVVIGGGTGLSTMLRGLKIYTDDITAIVTVADDGGGSGKLRQDLGILPPGDIRNCILALANTEPIMESLLQYRFTEGDLKGQSFGNLFLAAMNGISSSFEVAVRNMSYVLAVTGKVLPVTLENIKLCAEFENGMVVAGESKIPEIGINYSTKIKNISLIPKRPKAVEECISEIKFADIIVLGPGSLYTSVIPNLLVSEITEAIMSSTAIKIYVCNVMTQPGETTNYHLSDHIKAIEDHSAKGIIDYVIVNNEQLPLNVQKRYEQDNAHQVYIDDIKNSRLKVVKEELLQINGDLVRHNTEKLADCIIDIFCKKYDGNQNNDDCKIYISSKSYGKLESRYKIIKTQD